MSLSGSRCKITASYIIAFACGIVLVTVWHQNSNIRYVYEDAVVPVDTSQLCDKRCQREKAMEHLMGPDIKQDDPRLIQVLAEHFIDKERPFMNKLSFPLFKTPQAEKIDKILKAKKNGFYVECGGLDGERSSNTIWLELERGWTGLLVEMDPSYYLQLRGKNRRGFSLNACLSPKSYPTQINFEEHRVGSGRLVEDQKQTSKIVHSTYCFPLYSVMLALNKTHIDYLSLDVEGVEFEVLATIPFDKLDISTLSVEYVHVDKKDHMKKLMEENGYELNSTVAITDRSINLFANDYIFKKKGLHV